MNKRKLKLSEMLGFDVLNVSEISIKDVMIV